MSLRNDITQAGLNAAKRLIGEDPSLTAAGFANELHRAAGKIADGARRASTAVHDTFAADHADGTPSHSSADAAPLKDAAAKVAHEPASSGVRATLEGVAASFRQGVESASTGAPAENAAALRERALVVVGRAQDLIATAAPVAPTSLKVTARVATGSMTGADVANAMKPTKHMKGLIKGTAKHTTLAFFLSRMKEGADPQVFGALSAFSNDNKERLKALRSISHAIRDMKIDAPTTLSVLGGFNFTDSEPDYPSRLRALDVLGSHIESRAVAAEVVAGFSEDESQRLAALDKIVPSYNGMTADEIVGFLKGFQDARGKAWGAMKSKLTDRENIGKINELFGPPKGASDYKEIRGLAEAGLGIGARIFGSFRDGLNGRGGK